MINTPRIIITPGEPAGIGPDLVVQLAQQSFPVELVICADRQLLLDRAKLLKLPLTLHEYDPDKPASPQQAASLTIYHTPLTAEVTPGQLNAANSAYVLRTLALATDGCLMGIFSALVTGPVNKAIINEAGIAFTGHTEFLAERAGCKRVVMMLATAELRVALATTHLPLKDVPPAISPQGLTEVLRILQYDLQRNFAIAHPHILVAGLNPHAGENGYLGREEIEIIEPTLAALRKEGFNLTGPLPADTLFQPENLHKADAVLAMYHDQGLPVLKYQGFGRAINITLGLPFLRTSVDHGTALSLAGTLLARPDSLGAAITSAINMTKKCHE